MADAGLTEDGFGYCQDSTDWVIYNVTRNYPVATLDETGVLALRAKEGWKGTSWSPNERYLVYIADDGSVPTLRVADLTGGTTFNYSFSSPRKDTDKGFAWSSDSTRFAVWMVGRGDEPEPGDDPRFIRTLMFFDTRQPNNPYRVVPGVYNMEQGATGGLWSPDGQAYVFADQAGNLVYVDVNTLSTTILDTQVGQLAAWMPEMINFGMPGTGLRGQYFDASNFTVPKFFRLNPTVDFNWGTLSPDAALAADTFSVRWTGKVESLYSEAITFYVTHNDGARLWVNGQPIINNWTNTTNAVTDSGTITLAAGVKTDIVLEYYDNTGSASVKLEWQSARQARQVIPSTQLYPPEGQLAYTARSGGVDSVMIANPDGTETVQVFGTNAAWSPDGSQVAFITSAYDGNPELYVVNADGSGFPRRLTNHTAAESEPCWSPDSTKIIFASARTGGGDIYVVTVVGTSGVPTATRLTTAVDKEYQPTWSPNGLKITYSRDTTTSGGPEIYMMDANGANVTRLTTRNGYDISPYWSPDGSKIAIRGNISGRDQIWVITLSPRSVTQLTASAGGNYFQSWSPNGSKILFLSTRDGQAEVYTMNSDGTAQTNLSNTASTVESYAVWSADARQIAYIREGDVWMMNADGSNPHGLIVTPNRTEREIVWWQAKQIN